MSIQSEFNASIFVSEQLNRQLVNMAQDLAHRCVTECAERYGFDAEEAIRALGLAMVRLERKAPVKAKAPKVAKVSVPKAAFPLPYNGEFNDSCCYALRQNNGLYTQCAGLRKGENSFCKSCASSMQKTGAEVPEYGTIQQRMAVGVFEFVDPKGRKPVAYTKVMKKYKLTQEQVEEEAGKLGIVINPDHFVAPEGDSKRGRPSVPKAPKEKGAKGRPKKEKKVLQIEGDDEDLFAGLIQQANKADSEVESDAEEEIIVKPKKAGKTEEEKETERIAKEEEKLKKKMLAEHAKEQAKAEKEAKLAAEKVEKEAKLAAAKAEKEAKLAAEKAEKEAKKLAAEQAKEAAKAEKEAKLAAEKAAKETAKAEKKPAAKKEAAKKVEEPAEEGEVVKKIEFEGKKYLLSKKTGIVYDYLEYKENGEQVIVGKWDGKKIEFNNAGEESEEEENGEESEEEYDA